MFETGQDRKIAALRTSIYVHFFWVIFMYLKKYMDLAFLEAEKAKKVGEVPIGAVIVCNNEVIAQAHNLKESSQNCLAHAELIAINQASNRLNNWRLSECDIYITLSPCPMCASAIKQARVKNVYSALDSIDSYQKKLVNDVFLGDFLNPGVNFETNLEQSRSSKMLNSFFVEKRKK